VSAVHCIPTLSELCHHDSTRLNSNAISLSQYNTNTYRGLGHALYHIRIGHEGSVYPGSATHRPPISRCQSRREVDRTRHVLYSISSLQKSIPSFKDAPLLRKRLRSLHDQTHCLHLSYALPSDLSIVVSIQ